MKNNIINIIVIIDNNIEMAMSRLFQFMNLQSSILLKTMKKLPWFQILVSERVNKPKNIII